MRTRFTTFLQLFCKLVLNLLAHIRHLLRLAYVTALESNYEQCDERPQAEKPLEIAASPSGIYSNNFWTSEVASGVEYGSIRWNQSPSFQITNFHCDISPRPRQNTYSYSYRSTLVIRVAPVKGLLRTSPNALFFQVSHAASPDGAECGHSSRAAHSFLEIHSSAIVFAAEFVRAALPPTWERSAFRFFVLDSTTPVEALTYSSTFRIIGESALVPTHTIARTTEWAVLPALVYPTALALYTSLRKPMYGLAPHPRANSARLERPEAGRGTLFWLFTPKQLAPSTYFP
ncbi:hypothetical protein B0H13DRAFT_2681931 [Mycena leptocephala]|nr:hypothetical protein B0H13DRAFT_2681931 [Mycena leptocephala]